MRHYDVFDVFANSIYGIWKHFVAMGILLIVFAMGIIVFPAILVGLIAAACIIVGLSLVSIGFRTRKLENEYSSVRYTIDELV